MSFADDLQLDLQKQALQTFREKIKQENLRQDDEIKLTREFEQSLKKRRSDNAWADASETAREMHAKARHQLDALMRKTGEVSPEEKANAERLEFVLADFQRFASKQAAASTEKAVHPRSQQTTTWARTGHKPETKRK